MRESGQVIVRVQSEMEVQNWARFAGGMQAVADYGNGVRRIYRPVLNDKLETRSSFTGQHDDRGAEIWSWVYYSESSAMSRIGAEAFTAAYDRRMRGFMDDPKSFDMKRFAATRPAD